MTLTIRQVVVLVEAIGKRKNTEFRLDAAMHGLKVPDAPDFVDDSLPDLTPEQEAAMEAHLKKAMERKKAEKARGK